MPERRRRIKRVEVVVFCLVLAIAAMLAAGIFHKQQQDAAYAEATKKISSVALAILEFEADFGRYPCDETRGDLMDATGSTLGPSTGSANDYFRQLVAYGIQSEDIFSVAHPEAVPKPDHIIKPLATEALKPGEVGISYCYGLHSDSNPARPVLIAPMKSGTSRAHPTYGDRVAIWFVGGHQHPCTLDHEGNILLPDGTLLFDPARPIWQNRPIDIRHPEFPK
jgi:hypothetical protein